MGEVRWSFFPTEDAICFGCGRTLRRSAHWKQVQKSVSMAGDPRFVFTVGKSKVSVCPMCAMLAAMKDNGNHDIREGEFNENTMANIHRKHKREILDRRKSGESYLDMLKSMYPEQINKEKQK